MKNLFVLLFLIFFVNACVKEEIDLEKISVEADANPSLAIPLVYGNVTLDQLLPNTEGEDVFLYTDSEDLLHIKYSSLLDSFSIEDILDIVPEQDTAVSFFSGSFGNDFDFSTNDFNNNIAITSEKTIFYTFKPAEDSGIEIDSMTIKSGQLKIDIQANFKFTGDYSLEFPYVISPSGEKLKVKYSVVDGSSVTSKYIDVTGYRVGLVEEGTNLPNKLKTIYSLNIKRSSTAISDGSEIECTVTTHNLNISSAYGFVGFQSMVLNEETIDLDFNNQLMSGNLYLASPSIKLNLENSFGLPMRATLSPNMRGIIEGGTDIPFVVNPPNNPKNLNFPAFPAQVGQTVTDQLVIDNNTSNISQLLEAMPNKIIFGGKFEANPENDQSIYNFITDKSYLKASLDLDLPIHLELKNLAFSDTLEMDLSDIIKNLEDVTKLELDVRFTNGLPLQLKAQLYFYEQKSPYNTEIALLPIDSLMQNNTGLLIASGTTQNGKVVNDTETFQNISITGTKLQKIKQTKYALLKIYLNTDQPGSGTVHNPVKVLSSDNFGFKIGAKASADVNMN